MLRVMQTKLHPVNALIPNPAELEIVKGESATVTVSGAIGELEAEVTTANITTSVSGNVVTVTTTNNSASSDTLTITDTSGGGEVEVPITCTAE